MDSALEGKRIGFIGCGAMARALAGGLVAAGFPPDRIHASDPDPKGRRRFAEETGAKPGESNAETASAVDALVLAVKPGLVSRVAAGLPRDLSPAPLFVSIAAGVSLSRLEGDLPAGARVIRAMPNTPALVGTGATATCANPRATEADQALADALFQAVGITWRAPGEAALDAVTGLSGSGPAYVFLVLEALADAGVRQGLPRDAASRLATQTVLGAARLAQETGLHPATLKDQVTSPGGTTIAGVEQLEARGLRAALQAAVAAATARSRELGEG